MKINDEKQKVVQIGDRIFFDLPARDPKTVSSRDLEDMKAERALSDEWFEEGE